MNDLLVDLGAYFISHNIGTKDGKDVFRDFIPASPDECLAIEEYKGRSSNFDNIGIRYVQINYRAVTYRKAKDMSFKAFKLFQICTEDTPINLGPDRTATIVCSGSPFKSKVDSQKRVTFTFNLRIYTQYE